MMRRYGYLVLAFALLISLSIPDRVSNSIRCATVGVITPTWRHFGNIKELFLKITTVWPSGGYHTPPSVVKELEMIRLENHQLRSQMELLKAELKLTRLTSQQAETLMQNSQADAYAQRRKEELFRQLELYSHAMTARVVFRENGSWKSSVWVNVGESTNRRLQTPLIKKNSPVVLGTTVVGLVDYVGESRSRIRLLTDRALTPSVRVVRGSQQKQMAFREVEKVVNFFSSYEDGLIAKQLRPLLFHLKEPLSSAERNLYLAKGEIQGMRYPLWRSRGTVLQGSGFNYDFEDLEGPSRDLRTGKSDSSHGEGISLIKRGDVVVTTGMDGLFPAGLSVGIISKVYPLKEGATSYEADIQSLVDEFDDLTFVTILPALEDN
jgi:rod shape-determining protein MreC